VLSRRDARVGWIFIRLGGMILLFVAIGAVLALKSTSAPAVGPEGTLSFTASAASVTEPEQSTPENQKFLDDLRRQLRGESEPGE